MSKTRIKDPREVVKPGDIVKVKVLEIEVARKRIALTMRLDDPIGEARTSMREAGAAGRDARGARPMSNNRGGFTKSPAPAPAGNAFADAFAKARRN